MFIIDHHTDLVDRRQWRLLCRQHLVRHPGCELQEVGLDDDVGDIRRDLLISVRTDDSDLMTSPAQLLSDSHQTDLYTPGGTVVTRTGIRLQDLVHFISSRFVNLTIHVNTS